MTKSKDFWQEFWKTKSDPLHSSNTEDYYDRMAVELNMLFKVEDNSHVYEMACGSGTFFRKLGFHRTHYVGIDYSPAMIEAFKKTEPLVDVSVADVRKYLPPNKVDLIYSNGMLQYLTVSEARELIRQCATQLNAGGAIVHAAVPWKALRWQLFSGALANQQQNSLRAAAIYVAELTRLKPSLGTWFSLQSLRKIGDENGLKVTFFGSHYYPYRFHVKMTKNVS
jgi:trans-aconitate methyltransferase